MTRDALACRVKERRKMLFGNPRWNGIDFLEVADDQRSLCVHFFGRVPEGLTLENVCIEGGRRIRGIKATRIEIDRSDAPEVDDCLRIALDQSGDFSTYRLCLVERVPDPDERSMQVQRCACEAGFRPLSGMDPRYACIEFSFKIDCPSDLDCKTPPACPPPSYPAPEINYLAKDYASFRQLIFDRLAVTLPEWRERHVPDIGVAIVELMAYVGDYLSYKQDAVATEAYLATARRRISVRRHARLVDYRMHEGCNARAWVTVCTESDLDPIALSDFYFITGVPGLETTSGRTLEASALQHVARADYEVFEPVRIDSAQQMHFFAAHSTMRFYTWGDLECCLPKGATRATLLDEAEVPSSCAPHGAEGKDHGAHRAARHLRRVLKLKVGDVLIFEEAVGPTTGNEADADPAHRHAVRLTRVAHAEDHLLDHPVVEIEWGHEDALPFPLCLSARLPAPNCGRIDNVSVAHGNVVLVDHGARAHESLGPVDEDARVGDCACDDSIVDEVAIPARFTPTLDGAPLAFAQPIAPRASAAAAIAQDPRQALPALRLREHAGGQEKAKGPFWTAVYDLLDSARDERHVVVEMDEEGRALLRFGDGELGMQPASGTRFDAAYRIGNGPAGNVGRDTINCLVFRTGSLNGAAVHPRNPLPARGGTAPETVAEAKLFAPHAFRNRRERAITADDYAELAMRNPGVARAAAELRWMGSWYEARVAVDPAHTETADPALLAAVEAELFKYRRIGHDLCVVPARYVPLRLVLRVCVLPHFARGQVKAELLRVLGNGCLAGGERGFFHPDNLSFGDGVFVSRIVAAAAAVAGVELVDVVTLARLYEPLPVELKTTRRAPDGSDEVLDVPNTGVLPIDWMEIAQLDNDPDYPENGTLELTLGGGR